MKFKKRYLLLVVLLSFLFGLTVNAEETLFYDGAITNYRLVYDVYGDGTRIYDYNFVSNDTLFCVIDPIVNSKRNVSVYRWDYEVGDYYTTFYASNRFTYINGVLDGASAPLTWSLSSPFSLYYQNALGVNAFTNFPVFNSLTDAVLSYTSGDFSYVTNNAPPTLDNSIDYLHDVRFEHLMVTADGNPSELKYIFHWGSDVRYIPDEWKVSLYIKSAAKVKGIFGLTNKGTIESSLIRVTDDYFKYNKLSFLHSELMQNEEYSDFLDLANTKAGAIGTYILSTEYYLRIEHHSPLMWSYGGWYRISPDGKDDGTVKKIDTTGIIDGSGIWIPDFDGGIGSGKTTEHSYGTGTTMEDAQLNSAPLEIDETIFSDGILNGLKTMFNGLDDVSGFFNEVFSFLPREIGLIVTFIFSSIAILIVYKFIRG
ncbi:MAG TPA: hypothetical protein VJ845_00525 [Haploplasma sp.]|nr:hypothetical protein [Haploplasma sp.]